MIRIDSVRLFKVWKPGELLPIVRVQGFELADSYLAHLV